MLNTELCNKIKVKLSWISQSQGFFLKVLLTFREDGYWYQRHHPNHRCRHLPAWEKTTSITTYNMLVFSIWRKMLLMDVLLRGLLAWSYFHWNQEPHSFTSVEWGDSTPREWKRQSRNAAPALTSEGRLVCRGSMERSTWDMVILQGGRDGNCVPCLTQATKLTVHLTK